MTTGQITLEQDGHVLLIGLDRAEKYNAFDLALYGALSSAYGQLERDPDLRCGMLFAHGKHTTAGIDLAEWAPVFADSRWPDLPADGLDPLGIDPARRLSKPLIMATHGICYTIGIELLLATDIRIAADNTRFGQIEVRRGIYPVGGATVRLIQEVGWGNAMRYLLTADDFDAHEAYRIGLVQAVVPAGEQIAAARALAQVVAAQAPLGVYATLKSARTARLHGEPAAFATLLDDIGPIMHSADAAEGVRSFLERRTARFEGR